MQARIHPYFPYFHVDVAANVDLFSPAPGQLISALTGISASNTKIEDIAISIVAIFSWFCLHYNGKLLFAAAGQVNKIGADYIGLLVLGIFNAAIGHQNIRAEFQHSAAVGPLFVLYLLQALWT